MITYQCSGIQCDTDGIETTDKAELDEHVNQHHTLYCHVCTYGDKDMAAYAYNPGAPGSYHYCATHAKRAWETNDTFKRKVYPIERAANEDAERLPEDHPVEQHLGMP